MGPWVFYIFIVLFGQHHVVTFESPDRAGCEQMLRAVRAGIDAFYGRDNFKGQITGCLPREDVIR